MRQPSPDTRAAIVRGTLRLLSERDFAAVTTRSIAESASISEATLFRYFPRKEDILDSILQEVARGFFDELEQVIGLVDGPAEKLVALGRAHARFGARNRDLLCVIQREASYEGPRRASCIEGLKRFLGRLREILVAGIGAGVFREDLEVDVAVMSFHAVIHTVFNEERVLRGKPFPEPEFVARAEKYHQLLMGAFRGAR